MDGPGELTWAILLGCTPGVAATGYGDAALHTMMTPTRRGAAQAGAAVLSPGAEQMEAFLGDDDDYYDRAAANVRGQAQTPPSPRTPSAAPTPRSYEGSFDDAGEPRTPRTPVEVATPPSDGGSPAHAHLSFFPNERATMDSLHLDGTDIQTFSSPPRTGLTAGTMGWTAEVDALITPAGTRTGTRAGTGWASHASYDNLSELGDVSGLTEEQREARAALRTRQLLRTSRGDSALSSDLNYMSDLLAAFDAMVLKAFRDTDDVESMLKSDEFWKEVDTVESKLAHEEDFTKLEIKLRKEFERLEKEMKEEEEAIKSMMKSGALTAPDEESFALEDGEGKREHELYKGMPALRQAILTRRYVKYRVYAQDIAEMQREHDLDPGRALAFKEEGDFGASGFASGARALWKREMLAQHVRNQRAVEKDGAFVPEGAKPSRVLNAQKVQFVGPVFGHQKPPSVMELSGDTSVTDVSVVEEVFVPGQRWKPPPMPELRPPAPKMPTRRDLIQASWARPGVTLRATPDRAKKNFFEAHLPKTREGVPTPPSLPGSVRAPPQPGEDIPSHKLSLKGLPRNCTEDMVLEWMGVHADNVNQNYNNAKENYKRGIAMYKSADGWLTGIGAAKFLNKPACMRALAALDRTRMGTRVIYVDYVIEKILPPRGRLMLVNLHRKTTARDLEKMLRGWHLATSDDNQDPELLQDEEGFNTGEAILTFEDVESADNCLAKFQWSHPLHGMTIGCTPTPPLRYDDVNEAWFESDQLGNSTKKLLAQRPELAHINPPGTPPDKPRSRR